MMADNTRIEWTDATWNPITGCSIVSPGCRICYAMRLAGTRLKHLPSREGLTVETKAGPVWNGKVRLNEQWLDQPLRWKRPRRIFVCAHGDLFAENVPDEWIDRVFAVMALAPRHTFQVLTKRSARMRAYVSGFECDGARRFHVADAAGRLMEDGDNAHDQVANIAWPLPNVWLGVSAERQQEADERVPDLLATPADIRFVSAEPLFGPVDFTGLFWPQSCECRDNVPSLNSLDGTVYCAGCCEGAERLDIGTIDWIIVGGESGPGARPMHPAWARSIRDQCAEAGVPFFFKQWGAWSPTTSVDVYCHGPDRKRQYPNSEGISWLADGRVCFRDFTVGQHAKRIATGKAFNSRAIEVNKEAIADHHRAVEDSGRLLDNPLGYQWMYNVGKKAAGRLLDGVEHGEFPRRTV